MLTKLTLFLCVICAIVLVGCAKTETNTNGNANTAAATKTTTPASTTATTASGDKIGVPECDAYIAAYNACVSGKVPEVARAQYKTALDQLRTSWKKLADNPQTKPSLAAACNQATEQARTTMKMYNCNFL
jgi:hypothetical protein